jgi:tetratricopeptide (TPR) repeat protein
MVNVAAALFLAVLATQNAASSTAASDPAELVKQARKLVTDGRVDEALPLYRQALKADPDGFDVNLGLGNALDLAGKGTEARTHFTKAIAAATDDTRAQALTAMAVSFAFEGNAREAATFYQQVYDKQTAASNFGAAAGTANALGRVYLETGDLANAKRWYQTGLEAAKRQPAGEGAQLPLWDFRWTHAQARIAAREGHFDEARKQVAAARALIDGKPELKDQLPFWFYLAGYVELQAKKYDDALGFLKQADANDPFVQMLMAQAYDGAGRKDEAKAAWTNVLKSGAHNEQNAIARPAARKALGK